MKQFGVFAIIFVLLFAGTTAEKRKIKKKIRIASSEPSKVSYQPSKRYEEIRIAPSDESSYRFLNPFSLFSLVQFPNSECNSASGTQGTCYTGSECTQRGGTADGSCASGFGVCCIFSNDCNTETSQNGTYFTSPSTIPLVCSLMINPMNENICQVQGTKCFMWLHLWYFV